MLTVRRLLLSLTAIVVISSIVIAVLYPAWSRHGMAPGFDAASFVFASKFLVTKILSSRVIPRINPYWYNGFEVLHNAPVMVYVLLGSLFVVFKNAELVSKLGQIVIIVSIATSMFCVLNKRHGLWAAAVGAFLLALAPLTVWEIVASGSYHRILGMVFYPPAFYFATQLLEDRTRWLNISLLALFQSLAIMSHPMTGAGLMLFLSIYILLFLTMSKDAPKIRILMYWIVALAGTLALSAWYLGPFFVERTAWLSLPEEVYKLSSVPLRRAVYLLGVPSLIFAVYGAFRRRSAQDRALLATTVIATLVALGSHLSVTLYGLAQIMYPLIAVYFGTFAIAYLVATVVSDVSLTKNALIGAVLIAVVALSTLLIAAWEVPQHVILSGLYYGRNEQVAVSHLKAMPYAGRVMPMKYPFSYLIWWIPARAEKPMVEGWFYSLTPTGRQIAWMYDAIDKGFPEYSATVLDNMNAKYLMTNAVFEKSGTRYKRFLNIMQEKGFVEEFENEAYRIYVNKQDSAYAKIPAGRVLAIGKHSSIVAQVIPGTVASPTINVDDFDLETLKLFDMVVLHGFGYRSQGGAENLIRDYVKDGGMVVVDLQGLEGNPLEQNPGFFGVTPVNVIIDGEADYEIVREDPAVEHFDPPRVDFSFEGEPWSSISYVGLDGEILRVRHGGQTTTVLGFRKVDNRKIYFLGANLFFHVYVTHNNSELRLLRTGVVATKQRSPAATVHQETFEPERAIFTVRASQPVPVLIAYAWSPHWKAYIDGQPVATDNVTDLILVRVPEGRHRVEVKYENTPIHYYSSALSLLTLVAFGALILRDRRRQAVESKETT